MTGSDVERWLLIAKEHAVAKGQRVRTEHMLKVTKAVAMTLSGEKVIAAQERWAYQSDAYQKAIERYADATEKEQELSARLEAGRLKFEIWRTEQATQREEMRLAR